MGSPRGTGRARGTPALFCLTKPLKPSSRLCWEVAAFRLASHVPPSCSQPLGVELSSRHSEPWPGLRCFARCLLRCCVSGTWVLTLLWVCKEPSQEGRLGRKLQPSLLRHCRGCMRLQFSWWHYFVTCRFLPVRSYFRFSRD